MARKSKKNKTKYHSKVWELAEQMGAIPAPERPNIEFKFKVTEDMISCEEIDKNKMNQQLLYKTKCTVIGPMQYSDGRNIRGYFTEELGKLNITVFDHYNKPFIDEEVKETQDMADYLKMLLQEEKYDEIYEKRAIRKYDLALIDHSDFIIFHFIPGVVTVGSWEEFFQANSKKRPIFFITEGGKHLTPIWVMWTINPKYIYSSKEDVLDVIKKIDSGKIMLDSDRWRLFKKEFR